MARAKIRRLNAFCAALAVAWLLPIVWMAFNALLTTQAFTGSAPLHFTLSNFEAALSMKDWGTAYLSSVVTATITTAAVMALAIPGAYALAKWPNRSGGAFALLLGTRILPPASTVVAYVIFGSTLGIMDTWAALILAGLVMQVGWVTAVLAVSLAPYSSALEDWLVSRGGNPLTAALLYIDVRARTQIFALSMLCWLLQWGEFFFATALTGGGSSQTVTVLVAGFSTGQDIRWGPMFAACILAGAPVILTIVFASALFTRFLRRITRRDRAAF